MIGDWDLRAASELASFFNRHQIRATIETPIYQPEYSFILAEGRKEQIDLKTYVDQLEPLLKNKNCIIIASPDVNPLTEFVLGYINNVEYEKLFNEETDITNKPHAIVAVKTVSPGSKQSPRHSPERVFYNEIRPDGDAKNGDLSPVEYLRGFRSNAFEDTQEVMAAFHSQSQANREDYVTFGHLAILPNPFGRSGHYIIILNGVSGPATFALTHTLTGNAESEFSAYDPQTFDAAAECEGILNQILLAIRNAEVLKAIQCLIKVYVGAGPKHMREGTSALPYDWRRILSWSLYGEKDDESGLKPPIQVIQADKGK
jgi:hypothetical protein